MLVCVVLMGRSLFSGGTPVALLELYTAVMSPRDKERSERFEVVLGNHRGGLTAAPLPPPQIELLGSEVRGLRECRQQDTVGPSPAFGKRDIFLTLI